MSSTMRKLMNFPVGIRTTVTATNDNDIPNRAQVVSMISGKLNVKDSVRAVAYSNVTLSGAQTVDGVSLVDGDRVLLKDQTDASQNGIYVVATGAWSRATDADTGEELKPYTKVFAREGADHTGHSYVLQASSDITVGTDDQTWVHEATLSTDAADIEVDQTNLSNFSGANIQAALESVDDAFDSNATTVSNLDTRLDNLSGVTGSDLGTFTGGVITDNLDIKAAMQELETKSVANAAIYDNNRYESASTSLTQSNAITFNHAIGTKYLSNIKVYEAATGEDITQTVTIIAVDSNNITVQNDDTTIDVIVVCAK